MYIGKLVHPSKEIDEDADDKAHLDDEAPKVIKFIHSSKGHEFMNAVVLTEEEAPLSHEVFKKGDDDGEDDAQSAAGSDEDGAQNEKKAEKDII